MNYKEAVKRVKDRLGRRYWVDSWESRTRNHLWLQYLGNRYFYTIVIGEYGDMRLEIEENNRLISVILGNWKTGKNFEKILRSVR